MANELRLAFRDRSGASRRGFVLHELVLLFMIPLVLIGLMLPSVQAARESARRMYCSNNLKQISIGLMNYHDSWTGLPPGCASPLAGDRAHLNDPISEGNFGWGTAVLPQLEWGGLYERITFLQNDLSASLDQPGNLEAMQTAPLREFRCPTAGELTINAARPFSGARSIRNQPLALSNYVASNGSGELRRDGLFAGGEANGLFFVGGKMNFNSVPDGLSHTIAIGERAWKREGGYWHPDVEYRAAVVFGTRGVRQNSQHGLADSLACGKYRLNFSAVDATTGAGQQFARRAFSSNHPHGANFVMADGSVHFFPDDIDADMDPLTQTVRTEGTADSIWERLLHASDGSYLTDTDY
jgi:prepilin-type processing-associated H-X9-DG protein